MQSRQKKSLVCYFKIICSVPLPFPNIFLNFFSLLWRCVFRTYSSNNISKLYKTHNQSVAKYKNLLSRTFKHANVLRKGSLHPTWKSLCWMYLITENVQRCNMNIFFLAFKRSVPSKNAVIKQNCGCKSETSEVN